MPDQNTQTFAETGTTITFEPETNIIRARFSDQSPDEILLAREVGWGAMTILSFAEQAKSPPVHLLICAEHLAPRTHMQYDAGDAFFKALKSPTVGKVAFCCVSKQFHWVIATVKILSGKEIRYFDTESEARTWLAAD